MYQVFLDVIPLPIAPSKITTFVGNRSQTVELINGDEYSIVKGAKLQEISFDFMVPSQSYPFMGSAMEALTSVTDKLGGITGAISSMVIFTQLQVLKESKRPFNFICVRMNQGMMLSGPFNTLKVTLEDYTILEDANNGSDYMVSVRLKEYKAITEQVYNANGSVSKERPK